MLVRAAQMNWGQLKQKGPPGGTVGGGPNALVGDKQGHGHAGKPWEPGKDVG